MFSVFHRNKKKAVSGERQARSAGGAELAQAALATKPELIPELKRDVAAATGADPALSWQTLLRRLREYREQGEGGLLLLRLQIAAVEQYTEHYAAELPAYLEAVGSNDPILLICNRQLQAGNPREARRFAEPYLQYLDSSPALFRDGHLELEGAIGRAVYEGFRGESAEGRLRPAGIVHFVLLYQSILRAIPMPEPAVYEKQTAASERRLLETLQLSPCDARLWLELARCRRAGDTPAFRSTIRRVLEYAPEEPLLGEAYAELAMSRLGKEPELASALCTLAQVYGDPAVAPRVLLGQLGIAPVGRPAAERMAREAGIQIGLNPKLVEILQNVQGT